MNRAAVFLSILFSIVSLNGWDGTVLGVGGSGDLSEAPRKVWWIYM